MANKNKRGITIVKELCPICTVELDGSALLNKKLIEKTENVKAIKDKVQWSKTLCLKCADMKIQGFILIGAVEAKTTDVTNPYRSGNVWCVKQEVADTLFAPHPAPPSGVAFIDVTVAEQMKLPGVNLNA